MRIFDEDGQMCLYDPAGSAGRMSPARSAAESRSTRTSGSFSRRSLELKAIPFMSLDLTPGAGNLLGEFYWELISPWHGGSSILNTGPAPLKEEDVYSLSQILQAAPPRRYYLSRTACLGILRRARERGKELPAQLKTALEAQAGISQQDESLEKLPTAFAANQRDEVRDLHDVAGALGAQPGMKQQTFVTEGCLNSWDTQQQRVLTPDGKVLTLAGADGGGGKNPAALLFAAGFCAGAAPTAGGIGWQEECSPTLKAAESGTNMVPSILCLNDQGGGVMDCSVGVTGTLRAQEHGHQPLVIDSKKSKVDGNEISHLLPQDDASAIYSGNILQSNFSKSPVAGAQMANQNKCYNNLVMARIFGQQSYAHYAEGISTLAATGGTLGGGGENLVVNEHLQATPEADPQLYENHGIDSRYRGPLPVAPTMSARYGTGGNNVPLIAQDTDTFCITGNAIDRQPQNGGNGIGYKRDIAYTLTATDHHAVYSRQRVDVFKDDDVASTESARQHKDATDLVCQPSYQETVGALTSSDRKGPNSQYVSQDKCVVEGPLLIRRLTPLECERLQGFPDGWTDLPGASDSARYKALGNSVAIPCVEYIMRGIVMAAGA